LFLTPRLLVLGLDDDGLHVMDDPRFSRFSSDPKFRPLPKKERKVAVDDRFKGLFKDKRFAAKDAAVDKRGRPNKTSTKENFKK